MIDARVGNGPVQELRAVARQVVMSRPRQQLAITLLDDVLRIVLIPDQRDGIRQRRPNRPGDPPARFVVVGIRSPIEWQRQLPD
jgi:hypothetical protein